jgi:NAD(P)-dependent dehydrogenase (short-subunit alcohol dehydrogenase family)
MTVSESNMDKTAVITGGSEGLGAALAEALVAQGWVVRIDGRRPDRLRRTAARVGAVPVAGDVTDASHRAELLGAGPIDLVINNAGSLGPVPLPALAHASLTAVRDLFEANVVAPLALMQEAAPRMEGRHGAIINITSDAAVEAYPGWGAYGASKAALEQLSAVFAVERPDLRVWWIDPGDMRTSMHRAAFPGTDISDRPLPEAVAPVVLSLLVERPPSGRLRAADLLAPGRAAVAR